MSDDALEKRPWAANAPSEETHVVVIHYDTLDNRWPQLLDSINVARVDPHQEGARIEDVIARYPEHTPIWVVPIPHGEQIGATPLHEFEHPAKAVYVFGHDHATHRAPAGTVAVSIVTSRLRKSLYADQAGAMVLWDRRLKTGRWN
jgi:hypothetical protein